MNGSPLVAKEGERILAPSRRPDGTLRKPVRIRAGYTPQDEVAIYQSKGALMKQGKPLVPPGYDPEDVLKPKTKAAKKNEKRKEKKQQAAVAGGSQDPVSASKVDASAQVEKPGVKLSHPETDADVAHVAEQLNSLRVSPSTGDSAKEVNSKDVDLDKRIRALRKKIRTTEALQTSASLTQEQKEKVSKLDTWRKELLSLEAEAAA